MPHYPPYWAVDGNYMVVVVGRGGLITAGGKGERDRQSEQSWVNPPKVLRTNEIVRSVIIT